MRWMIFMVMAVMAVMVIFSGCQQAVVEATQGEGQSNQLIEGEQGNIIEDGDEGNTGNNIELEDLALCLKEMGATMYGTSWCSHCNAQKADFGDSFENINFVDCDEDRDTCVDAGVKGYPTWEIDGELLVGRQPLDNLAKAADCTV